MEAQIPQAAAPQTPTCCVVQLDAKKGSKKPVPACGDLSVEVIAEIADATVSWRDAKYVIGRLESLREREHLPGLALWYSHPKYPVDVPAPLDVAFEPYELDEGRAPLADLIGSASPTSDPEELAAMRSSRIRRTLARLGVPLIVFVSQLPNAITQLTIHRNSFAVWIWAGIFATFVVAAVVVWWWSDQWLIVPGGVVIRKNMVGKVGESLKLYTPADSTLIIRPQHFGNSLELWQGPQVKRRLATKLECAALVAAWQSHIPAPDPSRLSDLT